MNADQFDRTRFFESEGKSNYCIRPAGQRSILNTKSISSGLAAAIIPTTPAQQEYD